MSTPLLKNENRWVLRSFILGLLLLTAYMVGLVPKATTIKDFLSVDVSKSLAALAGSILLLVLGNIIGQRGKARIIYLKWQHPEPGHRAFTHFALHDRRFDSRMLTERMGRPLPIDPVEQNRVWYKLYINSKNDDSIQATHREWLLYRDLTWFATIWLPIGVAVLVYRSFDPLSAAFIALLVGTWLALARSARVRGNRFVSTVLAVFAARDEKELPSGD